VALDGVANVAGAILFGIVEDEVIFEFVLYKLLVVEDLAQVLLRVVIELNVLNRYHGEELVEDDALGLVRLVAVTLTEKFKEKLNLVLFAGLEDLGWVGKKVPMPRMNSSSEMRWVSS
jgi:hypothetical protein